MTKSLPFLETYESVYSIFLRSFVFVSQLYLLLGFLQCYELINNFFTWIQQSCDFFNHRVLPQLRPQQEQNNES